MKSKYIKFIKKTLLVFPLGLVLSILISLTLFEGMISSIIFAALFSFIIIFNNWFEYEKFENLEKFDFLESQHSITLESNAENWSVLNRVLDLQITKVKSISKTGTFKKVIIEQKFIDSILYLIKEKDNIEIRIRKKYLNFIPDMARNYKIIKKLTKEIKITTANNVYN